MFQLCPEYLISYNYFQMKTLEAKAEADKEPAEYRLCPNFEHIRKSINLSLVEGSKVAVEVGAASIAGVGCLSVRGRKVTRPIHSNPVEKRVLVERRVCPITKMEIVSEVNQRGEVFVTRLPFKVSYFD